MAIKNFAVFNDEKDLVMVQDGFRTQGEAREYILNNNLTGEYYFIGECDDLEEEELKNE